MADREYDLEDRLLEHAAIVVQLTEKMRSGRAANHVAGQLLRSGTSPLFNHGETEGAESMKDFIHKLSVCQKELKESRRALKLIAKARLMDDVSAVDPIIQETEELIRIFGAAIRTSRTKLVKESGEEYGVEPSH